MILQPAMIVKQLSTSNSMELGFASTFSHQLNIFFNGKIGKGDSMESVFS